MGPDAIGGAPSFPIPILFAVSGLLAIPLYLVGRRLRGDAARFLIGALWLRYIMSVFHEVTYPDIVAGLSLNAIGSIVVTGAGLMLIDKRHLLLKALVPVYALIVLALFSAQLNAGVFTALNAVVKYLYFCTLLIATYEALKVNPPGVLFRRLLVAFAPLLVFQVLSVATGVVKASELDGSRSYIGGYNHEAAFSVGLATFFVVAAFAQGIGRFAKAALLAVILLGIVLANYRTTIVGLLPFVVFLAVSRTARLVIPRQRVALAFAMLAAALVVLVVMAGMTEDRFGELAQFLSNPGQYIKPLEQFTVEERRLLSGRPYIWSGYIFTWVDSAPIQHLFGFGPDSWPAWFRVYPHNTLVGFLFELGLVGLTALIWWWAAMLWQATRAMRGVRADLVLAQISFILLNLATMALWQIEGLIMFAIICGYSVYCASQARVSRSERQLPRGMQTATGAESVGGVSFRSQ